MPMPDTQNNYSQNVEKSRRNLNLNSTLHLTPIFKLKKDQFNRLCKGIQVKKIYRHPHSGTDQEKILAGGIPHMNLQDLNTFHSNYEETLPEFKYYSGACRHFAFIRSKQICFRPSSIAVDGLY
jgi:hypothetical protein